MKMVKKTQKNVAMDYVPVIGVLLLTVLQLIAHQSHMPIWLSVFVVLVCVLKFLSHKNYQEKIPFIVRTVLIISSSAIFILYYRTNFSVDMAASFLFLACALKIMELQKHKDVYVFIFTMLYLSAVSFLFEQGVFQTFLQLIITSICFSLLFSIQITDKSFAFSYQKIFSYHTKTLFKMICVAIPLVVILFLFFPRISPLWQMPIKTDKAKTGMSEEMSPGDVSELAKTSGPAFRATFNFEMPERSDLYWRGLVLDHFDGRKWLQSGGQQIWDGNFRVDPGRFFNSEKPTYQIMLEPHQRKWAFALEASEIASSNLIESEMGLLRLKNEAIQATRYQLSYQRKDASKLISTIPSAYQIKHVDRKKSYQYQDLQLPPKHFNPKTQEFIQRLQISFPDKERLMVYLLNNFRQEPFFYTLEPPLMGEDYIDEFLFQEKKGFCEHFAGAFTYMLRLAGIPSRVVIGYQGGEYNTQSKYLIVSQYDAHAWVEAFLPKYGWIRLDPTAMVSPSRISEGSGRAFADEQSFLENSPFASAAMKFGMLNWVRLRLDEINFQWQSLVVNYNQDQQDSFITAALGENSLLRIALLFVYILIAIFVIMLGYLGFKRLSGYSNAEKKYLIWLFVLSRFGIKRDQGETPRNFLLRIQKTKYKRLVSMTQKQTERLEESQYRGK